MKTIKDAILMVKNTKNHQELCDVVDKIDAMFIKDVPEIVMTDDDWELLNIEITKNIFAYNFAYN